MEQSQTLTLTHSRSLAHSLTHAPLTHTHRHIMTCLTSITQKNIYQHQVPSSKLLQNNYVICSPEIHKFTNANSATRPIPIWPGAGRERSGRERWWKKEAIQHVPRMTSCRYPWALYERSGFTYVQTYVSLCYICFKQIYICSNLCFIMLHMFQPSAPLHYVTLCYKRI